MSYTLELPDKGRYGFELPESRISAVVQETAVGFHCMIGGLAGVGPRKDHPRQRCVAGGLWWA